MILIVIELVATSLIRLSKGEECSVPTILLEVLSLSFTSHCEYHQKNKSMRYFIITV